MRDIEWWLGIAIRIASRLHLLSRISNPESRLSKKETPAANCVAGAGLAPESAGQGQVGVGEEKPEPKMVSSHEPWYWIAPMS